MNIYQGESTRRTFLARIPAVGLASALPLVLTEPGLCEDAQAKKSASKKRDKGPRLELSLVQDFVGVAHRDFDRVKELLEAHPTLVNAAHDWGGGDWETALGAAAHMGRRDIALYLLDHRARLDVFAAAMLGKLDVVKASVAAFPETPKVPGPHGISLIRHAEAGGPEAKEVLDYLRSLEKA